MKNRWIYKKKKNERKSTFKCKVHYVIEQQPTYQEKFPYKRTKQNIYQNGHTQQQKTTFQLI
mgnify:FL=1